ncbi:MAG: hypothetical protein RL885_03445, partial [Planctomycetota bacterium]
CSISSLELTAVSFDQVLGAYENQAIAALDPLRTQSLKGLLRRVIGKIFGDEHLIEGYCSEFEARNAAGRAPRAEPASGSH